MKKMILIWAMVISCIVSSNCFAKSASESKGVNVSKEQTEKNIFYFKKEIGLTDNQENQIKALIYDIQQSLSTNKTKLDASMVDLSRMIRNKDDMGLIRKKLEEVSKIQVDSTCIDIENGRKVESVLSPAQLDKWNAIKAREASPRK